MSRAQTIENQEEKETKVVQLHAITGGKTGEDNWLSDLPAGSVFLTRRKSSGAVGQDRSILIQFHKIFQTERGAVYLSENMGGNQEFWTVSKDFSNRYELFEVQQWGREEQPIPQEKEEKDNSNGNGEGTL